MPTGFNLRQRQGPCCWPAVRCAADIISKPVWALWFLGPRRNTYASHLYRDCGNQYDNRGKKDVDATALIGGHIELQPGAMFRRYRLRGTCLPAALLSRSASDAHCRQRSAIRFQVILLFGSRVNRAIFSQPVACRRNSSWGFSVLILQSVSSYNAKLPS